MINRRAFLGAVGLAFSSPAAALSGSTYATVHKDPSCTCCRAWIEHLRNAGYRAEVVLEADVEPVKRRLGVPERLWSCHTAEIGGYVIEGHVPASAIARLLSERPTFRGLSVPGMPIGSPGMEVPGQAPEIYDVVAFGTTAETPFMTFRGTLRNPREGTQRLNE